MSDFASAAPPGSGENVRLPSYFPLVAKKCKDVSKTFFDCFSEASAYDGSQVGVQRGRNAAARWR